MPAERTIEKMGADEVQALKEKLQEQEAMLNDAADEDTIGASQYLQDVGALRQAVARNKKILERDKMLVPTSGAQRDAIVKEIECLQEIVLNEMPTKTEMNLPLGSEESDKAVQKNKAFQSKYIGVLLRLKDLKRRLDPDDPYAGNLERIRPK